MSDARLFIYVSKLYDCEDPMNDLFNILTEALNFNSRNAIWGSVLWKWLLCSMSGRR